jgi:hypothetical protein
MRVSHTPDICFDQAELFQRVYGLDYVSSPFTKEEIDKVIKSILVDKAPGPDGFNGMFLKVCLDIIGPDFYKLCEELWEGKISLHSVNNSLHSVFVVFIMFLNYVRNYGTIDLYHC